VTPKVISNIVSAIEENGSPNFEMLDGFDDLPEDLQDKVKKAVEDGDVADDDKTDVSRALSFRICNVKLTVFSQGRFYD
jgi:hypothetical protein